MQYFLANITEIFLSACQIGQLKCTKFTFRWGFPSHPTRLSQANLLANCAKQNEKLQNNKIVMIRHSGGLQVRQIRSSKPVT